MIDILMAVYNGEKYLAEQIESILAQTEGGWHLHICDDCSSDNSFHVALEYSQRYPELITAYQNAVPTGSACANFMGMLKKSEADYVMFSDQDDFWHIDKVKLTYEKMKELEAELPVSPILVHTELEIADRELNVINASFTRYQGLKPGKNNLNSLLCQNNITGCTAMLNKQMVGIMKDAPPEKMLMHDWWAGLVAAAFGHIGFVDLPTIMYRQHGDNQLGAVNNCSLRGAVDVVRERAGTKKRVSITYKQAEWFYENYRKQLDENSRAILEKYIDIPNHSKPVRAVKLLKNGFLKQNFMTAVGQIIFC